MNPDFSVSNIKIQVLDHIVTVGSVFFWLFVLYWIRVQDGLQWELVGYYFPGMARVQYAVVFLGMILALYLLNQVVQSLEKGDRVDLLILIPTALVMLGGSIYFATQYPEVYTIRQGWAHDHEYLMAALLVIGMLYLTWREFGYIFLFLVGGIMLYALYGYVIPREFIFYHAGIPWQHLLQQLITDLAGFYGSLTQLMAAWIAPFLLYAGLLFGYGAFSLILRLAIQSGQYIESGVAQTAVLASAIIGSVNGSYAANAGMTGSFTIPTMIDSGIKRRNAAAIEAVASTSGQVLPPVMGASAFVMASFLRVPYVDILIAGLIPAAILVLSIVVGVHYTSIRDVEDQELEFDDFFDVELTTVDKVVAAIRFGIPFLILIYILGILQWTVMTAAFWTVISMILLGFIMPLPQRVYHDGTGALPNELYVQFINTINGLKRGAIICAPIAIILAAINGVVDLLMVTGVPSAMALMLIDLSGGILILAVLLGMLICIIMGVGMPTVAAYVIVAILVAPTFVNELGVVEISAHYMVFYAAVMAGITPPVAIAAVITSGIAEADFWQVCATAIKIAAPLFILPISFIYHPELVSMDPTLYSVYSGVITLIGAWTIIYGFTYRFSMRRRTALPIRWALFALGVLIMVYPGEMVRLGGVILFTAIFIGEKVLVRGLALPSRVEAN